MANYHFHFQREEAPPPSVSPYNPIYSEPGLLRQPYSEPGRVQQPYQNHVECNSLFQNRIVRSSLFQNQVDCNSLFQNQVEGPTSTPALRYKCLLLAIYKLFALVKHRIFNDQHAHQRTVHRGRHVSRSRSRTRSRRRA